MTVTHGRIGIENKYGWFAVALTHGLIRGKMAS